MEAYNDLLLRFRHERTGSEGLHNLSYGSKFKVYQRPKAKAASKKHSRGHTRNQSEEVLKDYPIPHVDKFKTIEAVPS